MLEGPAPFRDLKDFILDLTLSSVKKPAAGSQISTTSSNGTLSLEEGSAEELGKCVLIIKSADSWGVHLVPSGLVKSPNVALFSRPRRFLSFAVSSVSRMLAINLRQKRLFTFRQ